MAIVNKFNVNKQQVTLDADIIENMSANDVSYNASTQYDENTVGEKLSKLDSEIGIIEADLSYNRGGSVRDLNGTFFRGDSLTAVYYADVADAISVEISSRSYGATVISFFSSLENFDNSTFIESVPIEKGGVN